MDEKQAKELCLALMRADAQADVIDILTKAGLWEDRDLWRLYGDTENNYSPIGNQQSRPEAALVEKIVNAVDARLMNECHVRKIDPEGQDAPGSIRDAVALFFGNGSYGRIHEWSEKERGLIADGITLAATGLTPRRGGGNLCFTIADIGEGQTPERIPDTFCSLDRRNKQYINFVQGRFNMGGTGVLPFCGEHKLQLILTKRNPLIAQGEKNHPTDHMWGFTIVRRETHARRGSMYSYLAPLDVRPGERRGRVLRFSSDTMPIFPLVADAYARPSTWGSLVKLYDFQLSGGRSHILRKDGILSRLDLLLPDIALPIRLHECREGYKGDLGSFDTPLTGVSVRLEDGKGDNLEEGFPNSSPLRAEGEEMTAKIYAFKKGKADTYRSNEGIIFTYNGQTHGHLTKDFFTRKDAGRLNRIADSILVLVDCTKFTPRAYEDLFMNSRDRLRGGKLRTETESALEELLKNNGPLRELKERRKREELAEQIGDSKPLEQVLESVFKNNPGLSALFLQGNRLSSPVKPKRVASEEHKPFVGRSFPTYFKFKDQAPGFQLKRGCPINFRSRITFETDAENEYFGRKVDPGSFTLAMTSGARELPVENYAGPNLQNGIAVLSVRLPANCEVGDTIHYVARTIDTAQLNPFENRFTINVTQEVKSRGGTSPTKKQPTDKPGDDRDAPGGLSIPKPKLVYEKEWNSQTPPFDAFTALRVIIDSNDEGQDVYDFYVNMDNRYLVRELTDAPGDKEVIGTRFQCMLVLLGLSLLHDHITTQGSEAPESNGDSSKKESEIEKKIEQVTRAIAPILLPAIRTLGSLDAETVDVADDSGEAA